MRILIVEDEIKIREGMARLITTHTRHTVVGEAQNGQEGLDMVLRHKPDLVITDIRMPVMDGLEMTRRLYDMQSHTHVVILSGYSEFDYAREAMQYGVDDYLLKPLAAEDIQTLLERTEERMKREAQKNAGTPQQFMKELLFQTQELSGKDNSQLEKVCGFKPDMSYRLYGVYIGNTASTYEAELKEKVTEIKDKYLSVLFIPVALENRRQLLIWTGFLCEEDDTKVLQAMKRKVVNPYKRKEDVVWATVTADSYEEFPERYQKFEELIQKGMALTEEQILTEELLQTTAWEELKYPADIANDLKNAVCEGKRDKIREYGDSFKQYVRQGIYKSREIRQAYLKVLYMLLDTIHGMDRDIYEQIQNANVLQLSTEAVTLKELEAGYEDAIRILQRPTVDKEDISNYTIKRAINYIRMHFCEGITLEEVSGELGITPEYLSTLFNREMKVNFSTFLRQFRLSHAKRLLNGTELKVYEVAEKVGYGDPKYFARVFKEEFGVSPGEYRQMN